MRDILTFAVRNPREHAAFSQCLGFVSRGETPCRDSTRLWNRQKFVHGIRQKRIRRVKSLPASDANERDSQQKTKGARTVPPINATHFHQTEFLTGQRNAARLAFRTKTFFQKNAAFTEVRPRLIFYASSTVIFLHLHFESANLPVPPEPKANNKIGRHNFQQTR